MLVRYRTSLLWVTILVIIACNSLLIPLFLYSSFGSDTNLTLSPMSRLMHTLLSLWVFVLMPNMPFVGISQAILQQDEHELRHHLLAFAGVVVGGLCFYFGERQIYQVLALLFTEVFGLTSLAFLLHKNWMKAPSDKNKP